jgi:hypothetical protein
MMRSNYTGIMHIDAVTEVLDNLNTADGWIAKEAVESITFQIGIKGERFPEYLSVRSIAKAIDPFLMRYVESMVTTACIPNEALYYIGNPDY